MSGSAEGLGRLPDGHGPQPGGSRPPKAALLVAQHIVRDAVRAHEENYAALAQRDPRASMERKREHVGARARYVQRTFPDVLDQVMARDRASG